MQPPTCTNLRVRSTADAHKLFVAVQRGLLPMVKRRLDAEERLALRSGCVYVWEERPASAEVTGLGIERFTEGKRWSQSRVREEFLFYYEKYQPPPDVMLASTSNEPPQPPKDWEQLVKQTYSVYIDSDGARPKWHLTAYFTQQSVDALGTIDDMPAVRDMQVPAGHCVSTRATNKRQKLEDASRRRVSADPAPGSGGAAGKTTPSVPRTYAAFPPAYSGTTKKRRTPPRAERGASVSPATGKPSVTPIATQQVAGAMQQMQSPVSPASSVPPHMFPPYAGSPTQMGSPGMNSLYTGMPFAHPNAGASPTMASPAYALPPQYPPYDPHAAAVQQQRRQSLDAQFSGFDPTGAARRHSLEPSGGATTPFGIPPNAFAPPSPASSSASSAGSYPHAHTPTPPPPPHHAFGGMPGDGGHGQLPSFGQHPLSQHMMSAPIPNAAPQEHPQAFQTTPTAPAFQPFPPLQPDYPYGAYPYVSSGTVGQPQDTPIAVHMGPEGNLLAPLEMLESPTPYVRDPADERALKMLVPRVA